MTKISQLYSRLIHQLGEDTLCRELEGILKKHQGIAHRTRKPGRVDQCLSVLQDRRKEGMLLTPQIIARFVVQFNLSPASVYRLTRNLRSQEVQIRAVDILREQERLRSGVY